MTTVSNPQTKTDKAIELFTYGDRVGAMKIFKTFKIGFTPDERRTIEIAYESQTGNAKFYQDLGIDTDTLWQNAKEIIRQKYNL
ncbi:MAG: hypothetical protein ACK5M3_05525 [Dysgonomonas sp.]